MSSVEGAFLIFGGILIIGYLGEILGRRFNIPNVLLLLIMGYLLKLSGYVNVEALTGIQELFGTLALIVLLFDGGLSLNIKTVIFESSRSLLMSILITICSVFFSSLFFYLIGFDPILGAMLGAIAGGIGSTTTISIIQNISVPKEIADFLTLESSITDVFSIILTLVLVQALISGSFDLQTIGQGLASKFSIGLLTGIVAGISAIAILSRIEKGYNYMTTFALVLLLYSVTEFLAGSGAIAVLIFAIVFGNENTIRKTLNLGITEEQEMIKQLQSEISFFIRTFFFVFLGTVVTLGSLDNFLIALGLIIILFILRYACLKISLSNSTLTEHVNILTTINPRGLATAVLATYPLVAVTNEILVRPNVKLSSILPQLSNMPEIAFYLIILSIVLTTILLPIIAKPNNKNSKKISINKKIKNIQ